jgi:PAS domain S-box-containing protein
MNPHNSADEPSLDVGVPTLGESSQSVLAAILSSSEDALITKDLNGIIQSWNPGATRIFGYTAEEAIGQPALILMPQDRLGEDEMSLARLRRGQRVAPYNTQRVAKDGVPIDVALSVSPILSPDGNLTGVLQIVRDIRDRVAAEADRARISAIVDSTDDAIISKSLDGTVIAWNRGAERLFGYMSEEMIGQSITRILPPDRLDEEDRILSRLSRGDRVDHYETVRIHRDGRPVDVSVTISPIRDTFGRIVGASKVARNISERKIFEATMARVTKELEERVAARTAELEQAHQEMESFTHSIAHDLRGPLRAIASTCAMLKLDYGDVLPDDGKELIDRQVAAAKRLAQLIDDLLKYSRLGRSALNIDEVNITALAEDIAVEMRTARPDCEIVIEEGLTARGDKILLRLLIQNLLDNGCKFSPAGGPVELGQKSGTFYVKDLGRGFDMAYADKVFLPFERLVSGEDVPGTGIGLANVKRIIDKHGGSIWVNSNEGQGTTFFFTLG